MSSLSDRLERLRRGGHPPVTRRVQNSSSVVTTSEDERERGSPPGSGWKPLPSGVWERRIQYPALLPENFDDPFVLPQPVNGENLIFYDLETTGLSGGAGNTAFLIGLGQQVSGSFTVTQLFLADYPGEAVMLSRYAQLVSGDLPQVSYNGRSFDSQVLKTRFLLNRFQPMDLSQIDLLYPARRLWKTILPNLSLSTLEKEVLGVVREDDLPGREAPDAWFEWLNGDPGRIGKVFSHNADDITSMARLLVVMESLGADGQIEGSVRTPPSFRGLARQWAGRDQVRSCRCLEKGWASGESSCGRALARELRRAGDWDGANKLWTELVSAGIDFHSAVELSKYREHRLRDTVGAMEVLSGFEGVDLSVRHREELEHRKTRLKRKLEAGVTS